MSVEKGGENGEKKGDGGGGGVEISELTQLLRWLSKQQPFLGAGGDQTHDLRPIIKISDYKIGSQHSNIIA